MPWRGQTGPELSMPCTGLGLGWVWAVQWGIHGESMGNQWGTNGESMGSPVPGVCQGGQGLSPQPSRSCMSCTISSRVILEFPQFINSIGPMHQQMFFFPFKKRFDALALWGGYSNISHIPVYLESYIFCNFDLVILCWSLLTSPVVSVKQIITKNKNKTPCLYMHVIV